MKIKMLVEKVLWIRVNVYKMCVKHKLYTQGDCLQYSRMLDFVRDHDVDPTLDDMIIVARDILDHSDEGSYELEEMLCLLSNETMIRTYYYAD